VEKSPSRPSRCEGHPHIALTYLTITKALNSLQHLKRLNCHEWQIERTRVTLIERIFTDPFLKIDVHLSNHVIRVQKTAQQKPKALSIKILII
jgi:hypothetical protein